jgi:quinol monooxygenase YgiN
MIRHIVILQFKKDGKDYLSLMKQTVPLVNKIPGILSYELFENQSKYVPQNVTSIGLELKFMDQEALDVFMTHPKHYEANAIFEKYLADPPYMVLTHQI